MMLSKSEAEACELLKKNEKFYVMAHQRPDGDAYGSSLGLALSLRAAGKDVIVSNQDGMLPHFGFLPGAGTLIRADGPPELDRLFVSVDTADHLRLGPTYESWGRLPDLNIDHHVSNHQYARVNVVSADVPATAELLLWLVKEADLPLNADVASNFFVGLTTDTGSFRHRSTSSNSFRAAAELVDAGADPTDLAQHCYSSFAMSRLLLLREILNDTKFIDDATIGYFHLLPEMKQRAQASDQDTENLLDYLQMVRTVEVAFVLEPMGDGLIRASLRSRGKANVQEIASIFGGGGHVLAAGLRSRQPLPEIEKAILAAIREQRQVLGY